MVTRIDRNSPEAIERAWDDLAEEYARSIGPSGARRALAAVELAIVLQEIPSGQRAQILDAGGGNGYHALRLAELGHLVTIVDISSRMLACAREAAEKAGVEAQIETFKADVRRMDEAVSGTFDVVIACGTVISDCGYPQKALGAVSRVLAAGGKSCFSLRSLHWDYGQDGSGEPDYEKAGVHIIPGHKAFDWHLFSRGGIERLCRDAGLSLTRAVPVGLEEPPEEASDQALEEYVQKHLKLSENETALRRAPEIMAVSCKGR